VPAPGDDVIIDVPGPVTVSFSSGTASIRSLQCSKNLAISNGSFVIATTSAINGSLTLSGGNFDGGSDLTVSGLLTWSGGRMMGSGRTHASGNIVLNGSGQVLDARTLENLATATWTGADNISGANGGVFNNLAGATFEIQNDAVFSSSTFNNAGLLRKTSGVGTTTFTGSLANSGTVQVSTGTVALSGGGNHSGMFTVAWGTTLDFAGGTHTLLPNSSSVSGAGNVAFDGGQSTMAGGTYSITGNTTLNSGTVTFSANAWTTTATFYGGVLAGSGTVTVTGLLTWVGTTMIGLGGRTAANGGLALTGNSGRTLGGGRYFDNSGAATWSGSGALVVISGAVFNNLPGASLWVQTDASLSGGTAGTFNNSGLFRKSATAGTTTSSLVFNNNGTVDVQSGTFSLFGSGSHNGAFTVGLGATLTFGGSHNLSGTSGISGSGTVTFGVDGSGAGVTTISGSYTISGSTWITTGTVNFVSNVSLPSLVQLGGLLGGAGVVTVNGTLTWIGGSMSGSGRTEVRGGLTITDNTTKVLRGRTLNNWQVATWNGQGDISLADGAALNNASGAVFNVQSDTMMSCAGGSPVAFNNAGQFGKSLGGGTTTVGVPFQNTGTVDVRSGTLLVTGGGVGDGSFTVAAGSTLQLARDAYLLNAGSQVSGAGSVTFGLDVPTDRTMTVAGSYNVANTLVNAGTVNFVSNATTGTATISGGVLAGLGTVTVSGLLTWTGGTMSDAGHTVAGGDLAISGNNPKFLDGRILDNTAAATWSGTGDIRSSHGAVLNNQDAADFQAQSDANFTSEAGSTATINNAGTFSKSAGSGITTLAPLFNNTGTVDIQMGTLVLAADYTQSAGILTGAGVLVVNGLLTWTGGVMTGTGQTTANGGLLLDDTDGPELDVRTFNNAGSAVWTGSSFFYATSRSVFNNLPGATIDNQGDNLYLSNASTSPVFNNQGTFVKSAGTGSTRFDGGVIFNNSGSVLLQTGTLALKTGGIHSGSFSASEGTTLAFLARTVPFLLDEHNFLPGSSISALGTVLFDSGPSTIRGSYNAVITKVQNSGSVSFASDVNLNELRVHQGTVSGSGNVTIAGLFTWNEGYLTGTGQTIANGGMTISGNVLLSRPTLVNGASAVLTGGSIPPSMTLAEGAVFSNPSGSTCDIQGNRHFMTGSGAAPRFDNAGTLLQSAGSGTTDFHVPLVNSGDLSVQIGTLQLAGSFTNNGTAAVQVGTLFISGPFTNFSGTTLTGGTFMVQGVLRFTNADIQTNAATLVLDGVNALVLNQRDENAFANFALNDTAGSLTLTNGGSLATAGNFSNQGALTLGPGSAFTVTGDYSQTMAATLQVQIADSPGTGAFGQLAVYGQATLAGILSITLQNGFRPQVDDAFQIITFGSRAGDFDTILGLDLGGGLHFDPVYDAVGLTLITRR
jgi:hypothetical protein